MERGSLLNKRYRIVEVLGQGGMAAVYRAIDENLGVEVAVKENLFTTEEYARQFRLEATILASMRHAHLPRVSDHFVIEHQGQYLVMDHIEGEDLRQRMDRLGPLPEQEVIVIGVAICEALIYMHSRKPVILHRDIKPGNVRITPHGHIYLVDFGLAKLVHGREATSTGARAMTPGYSPPEQYGTARTDQRSDIYSLGATLYSALTDALPEDSLARAMGQSQLTPISRHNPRVSRTLAAAIEKSLEVKPENRYQAAEEFRDALLNSRSTSRKQQPIELILPPPPLTLTGGLPGDEKEQPAPVGNGQASAALAEAVPATPGPASESQLDALPAPASRSRRVGCAWAAVLFLVAVIAGGWIAYDIDNTLPQRILAMLPGGIALPGVPTATTAILPESSATPQPSPITEVIAELPTLTMTVTASPTPTETIPPTTTFTPEPTLAPTFTPLPTPMGGGIGQIAFVSDRTGAPEIWLINVDGTGLTQLTNIAEGACQPAWSPDGRRLVFISPCNRDSTIHAGASLFLINADGTNMVPLPSAPGGDFSPSWSPDGTHIAFTSLRFNSAESIYVIDLETNQVTNLADDLNRTSSQPAYSPDGQSIAHVISNGRVWVMDADGRHQHSLTTGGGEYVGADPAWSPDGSVIIFTRVNFGESINSTVLNAVPFSTSGAMPVEVSNSELVEDVSYSPDGYWLVFKTWATGSHDIFLMRANGVDRQPLVTDSSYEFDPAWRPNVP